MAKALRQTALWTAIACGPFALLFLLLRGGISDPAWTGLQFHFLVVSMTSFIALIMALLMIVAAAQLKDARVVFLSMAFLGIAGVFSVHGLTTPGALVHGPNPWIGFCARFSMLIGATFFALSTVGWGSRIERAIIRRQRTILITFSALLIGFAVIALGSSLRQDAPASTESGEVTATQATSSSAERDEYGYGPEATTASPAPVAAAPVIDMGPFGFLATDAVSAAVTISTLLLLTVVIVRYMRLYRIARMPLLAGFLIAAIFLFQAQVSMSTAPLWHASWWMYHVLMFGAFIAALGGMVAEYGQSRSLQGVVEGLLLRDSIAQLQRGYTEVIVALVRAVEAKDVYTRGHTQRVSDLSVRIAREMRLPQDHQRVIAQAAMLHDIGKIGVPDSILNKPGPLSPEEFDVVKEHPHRSHMIIKDVRSLRDTLGGVRHHHERLDGSGYPDGLAGDAIPMEARIIAVADVFDALTSPRPYRGAMSVQRALMILDEQAGTQLDLECVTALRKVVSTTAETAFATGDMVAVAAD